MLVVPLILPDGAPLCINSGKTSGCPSLKLVEKCHTRKVKGLYNIQVKSNLKRKGMVKLRSSL
jgi:hypothetical protein